MQKHFEYQTFQEAYVNLANHILNNPEHEVSSRNGASKEIQSLSYTVSDLTSYQFEVESLGRIDYKYASTFYDWMLSGSTDVKEVFKDYPHVAKFLEKPKSPDLPANFNTFYGPRIIDQLPKVVQELKSSPTTRRAVISILQSSDLDLLDKDETLEFPCCDSATFSIRENRLNIHLHMRSQNMGQVLKLDMYLWGKFACYLAEKLGYQPGVFNSTIVSAHVFDRDKEYIEKLELNG